MKSFLFTFYKDKKTIEWCFYKPYDKDGNVFKTYVTFTFSYDQLIQVAEDFNGTCFLFVLMDYASKRVYTEDDDEFDEYEVRFKNDALLFDTSKDIKDYLLSQIKVK